MKMLEIDSLDVQVDGKYILKDLSLELEAGKTYIIMGKNGTGKSTLLNVIMGNPQYDVTNGSIKFNGEDVTEKDATERAKEGMFLSFQNPVEIPGVILKDFLRFATKECGKNLTLMDFAQKLLNTADEIAMPRELALRELNVSLSGGEKKKSEILQACMLDPKLVMLDEIDSGLDVDATNIIAKEITKMQEDKSKTIILVTHHNDIIDKIAIDKVFVLANGKIAKQGDKELIKKIAKEGYKEFERD